MATKNSNTPNGYRDAGTMDLMSRGWTQRLMYDHLPPPVTDGADQCIRVGRMWSGSGKNPYWPWDAIFKAEREIIHSEDPKVRQLSKKMRERVLRS